MADQPVFPPYEALVSAAHAGASATNLALDAFIEPYGDWHHQPYVDFRDPRGRPIYEKPDPDSYTNAELRDGRLIHDRAIWERYEAHGRYFLTKDPVRIFRGTRYALGSREAYCDAALLFLLWALGDPR